MYLNLSLYSIFVTLQVTAAPVLQLLASNPPICAALTLAFIVLAVSVFLKWCIVRR